MDEEDRTCMSLCDGLIKLLLGRHKNGHFSYDFYRIGTHRT